MKSLKQFGIILTILLIGQGLHQYFGLPIPGTVLGIIILLLLLLFKIVKLHWVNKITEVLLEHLSLLFIPPGVAIMNEFHNFKGNILPLFLIIFTSTIIVMVVTGYTVQILIKWKKS